MLGNLLDLPGFEFNNTEQVRAELLPSDDTAGLLDNALKPLAKLEITSPQQGMERVGEIPIYQADALVRRSPSLQQTADAQPPQAWVNAALMQQLGLSAGAHVLLKQGTGQAQLRIALDAGLPNNCVRVAGAHPSTMNLGGLFGVIAMESA